MSRTTKWFIIALLATAIILLVRTGAVTPASVLGFIVVFTALIEKIMRIQILRKAQQTGSRQQFSSATLDDMTEQEAKDILEVSDNPTKTEIKEAYNKMIRKNHPDQGGSKYLAAKINKAKAILMKRYGH